MTENPFQLPGYQVIGMQDTGVAFDVHLQPPSPVAFMKNFSFSDLLQRTELEEDIIIDYGVDLSTI